MQFPLQLDLEIKYLTITDRYIYTVNEYGEILVINAAGYKKATGLMQDARHGLFAYQGFLYSLGDRGVIKWSPDGKFICEFAEKADTAIAYAGHIYASNREISKWTTDGEFVENLTGEKPITGDKNCGKYIYSVTPEGDIYRWSHGGPRELAYEMGFMPNEILYVYYDTVYAYINIVGDIILSRGPIIGLFDSFSQEGFITAETYGDYVSAIYKDRIDIWQKNGKFSHSINENTPSADLYSDYVNILPAIKAYNGGTIEIHRTPNKTILANIHPYELKLFLLEYRLCRSNMAHFCRNGWFMSWIVKKIMEKHYLHNLTATVRYYVWVRREDNA